MGNTKLKALVVDDSASTLTLVSALLSSLDTEVTTASDGKDGLEAFTLDPESFSIVFVDINMPELNGIQLAKKIRDLGSKVPIIAFTATATVEAGARSKSAGIDRYLSKATLNKKLLSAILSTYCGI